MTERKDWRVDTAPLLFFAVLLIAKTYYLVGYIVGSGQLWAVVSDSERRASLGSGATLLITGEFSHIAYYAVALAFDALVFYSLWVRRGAKARPKGFWENIFPLLTVFIPVTGFTLMFIPAVRELLPGYPADFLLTMNQAIPGFPFWMNLSGLLIGLFGAAFSIYAIAHLKASFGLRTAVRQLVTTGPYRRIRHPLYVGEIIHIFGIVLLAATPVAVILFIVAVAMQVIRAKIEERKFHATVPEYAAFARSTGFLWPKLF